MRCVERLDGAKACEILPLSAGVKSMASMSTHGWKERGEETARRVATCDANGEEMCRKLFQEPDVDALLP